MKPIVFLDFDDVIAIDPVHTGSRVLDAYVRHLHNEITELWSGVFDTTLVRNLLVLHEEFKPSYVISSSWATHLDRVQMVEVLERTGLAFVSESLNEHWCTPRGDVTGRLSEIEAWLELHAPLLEPAYVILDDHVSGGSVSGSWLEERAVLCNAWHGLTREKLELARTILRAQA